MESGCLVVKTVPRVRFFTWSTIVVPPTTFTDVVITSPGKIFRLVTVTDGLGTSSYQA